MTISRRAVQPAAPDASSDRRTFRRSPSRAFQAGIEMVPVGEAELDAFLKDDIERWADFGEFAKIGKY